MFCVQDRFEHPKFAELDLLSYHVFQGLDRAAILRKTYVEDLVISHKNSLTIAEVSAALLVL